MPGRESKYVDRLVDDWLRHGKIIVAVDYDETIYPWKIATREECWEVIDLLKQVQKAGIYLVIFTASYKERYKEITEYCKYVGLDIDSINKNPIKLPYGQEEGSKIFYNIFLCDRAGLESSMSILEKAYWMVKGARHFESVKGLTDIG